MSRNTPVANHIGGPAKSEQLWLVTDVAEYLRCSADAVYRMVERSEIPHTRIFKRKGLRFRPEDIERWAQLDRSVETLKDANG